MMFSGPDAPSSSRKVEPTITGAIMYGRK